MRHELWLVFGEDRPDQFRCEECGRVSTDLFTAIDHIFDRHSDENDQFYWRLIDTAFLQNRYWSPQQPTNAGFLLQPVTSGITVEIRHNPLQASATSPFQHFGIKSLPSSTTIQFIQKDRRQSVEDI